MIERKIEALLEEKFKEDAFSDCFLIEVKHNNNKVEVFIDSDTGVTFDTCRKVSRFLEHHIEEEGWLGEKYVLEVSSPGVGRPLQKKRQYPKNIGRKLEIHVKEGKPHTGTLIAVDEMSVTIEEKVRKKEGKRKKTEIVKHNIPFNAIKKAVVKISF